MTVEHRNLFWTLMAAMLPMVICAGTIITLGTLLTGHCS